MRFWGMGAPLLPVDRVQPATPAPSGNPVNGYRVDFAQKPDGSGTLITGNWQTLLRATDANVHVWQVTLSPVFRTQVGPNTIGRPTAANETGAPRFRMTFGAGGVTFRHEGPYPVCGASFSVAANDVTVEVMANDGVTVFTPQTLPSLLGWIAPDAAPQSNMPLFTGYASAALIGPFTASPWTRALWVYDSAGVSVTLTITGPFGTLTAQVPSGTRVPLPAGGLRFSAVASANAAVVEEISFT